MASIEQRKRFILLKFILLGGLPLKIFTIALSICGLYEFYNALRAKKINVIPVIGYALLAVYYLINNDFEKMMQCPGGCRACVTGSYGGGGKPCFWRSRAAPLQGQRYLSG